MVDEETIRLVEVYRKGGDSLQKAIQKAAASYPNSKEVEVELARYFTRNWKSDFLDC